MSVKSGWPDPDQLRTLHREAEEHRREWAIIIGLSKALEKERVAHMRRHRPGYDRETEHVERIRALERKVIAQKEHLRAIEEARVFELETEHKLSTALREASAALDQAHPWTARAVVSDILAELAVRKGPRPEHLSGMTVVVLPGDPAHREVWGVGDPDGE